MRSMRKLPSKLSNPGELEGLRLEWAALINLFSIIGVEVARFPAHMPLSAELPIPTPALRHFFQLFLNPHLIWQDKRMVVNMWGDSKCLSGERFAVSGCDELLCSGWNSHGRIIEDHLGLAFLLPSSSTSLCAGSGLSTCVRCQCSWSETIHLLSIARTSLLRNLIIYSNYGGGLPTLWTESWQEGKTSRVKRDDNLQADG